MRSTPVALVAVLLLGPAAARGASEDSSARPPAHASPGTRWGADYFPNVPLTTQDGKTVHLYEDLLEGKIVVIDLIYTRCLYACPLETARLAQVQKLLGDRVGSEVFFYSISIDPEHDTPAVLKAYAEKFHAGPGWTFLTGTREDVKLVSRKLGLLVDPAVNKDGHTPDLMIGNVPAGQWMRNSAVDNPRLLATTIGRFVDGWKAREPAKSYAQAPALSFTKGQYLFSTRCAACHSVGRGDRIGPDLAGVTQARDRTWLARFIAAPDRMLADGDPVATALHQRYGNVNMPNLGLGDADVASIIEYLGAPAAADGGAGASVAGAERPAYPE